MKQVIRTLIVDDEPLGRQRIRTLLEQEPDLAVVGECANGREAVAAVRKLVPDLVFLDVQMPLMNGFDVVEELGTAHLPVVIFVTAYDRYALKAFEVHALDYLLKPFDRERFQKALQRARHHLHRESIDALSRRLQALLADYQGRPKPAREGAFLKRLAVKSAGQVFFLNVEEIDWIEAAGNYAGLHVKDRTHLARETMAGLEARLDPDRFLRIHRSTIVNLDRIKALQPLYNGEYVFTLHDGTRLQSSRSYRDRVHALLNEAS
ncbi:MAG: LytR/AlgR family response regulator transcription factor [Rhodothermales bacterium]